MLQQRRFGWWDILHCPRTLCEQLFPCLIYTTGLINTFCCTWQRWTFLSSIGSQSSRLRPTEIDRGRHNVTDGQELHANHADFFPRPRKVDTVSHPVTAWKNINAFSLHIFHNRVDSNLSKVNTDSKGNPEFIKPKRQEIPIARTTHQCLWFGLSLCAVLVVHNAQRGAECAYLPPRGNMAGDTRRRSCHSVGRRSLHPLCWWSPFCQFSKTVCDRTDSEIVNLC